MNSVLTYFTGTRQKNIQLFIAAILFIFLAKYHLEIITFPYQLEYREGSQLQATRTIISGSNPFAENNQPECTNNYGIIYPLLCCIPTLISGLNLEGHRVISAIFILLSCFFTYKIIKRKSGSLQSSISFTLLYYASLLFFTTPLARPDSLALFLFVLSFYISDKNNYSIKSLITAAILGFVAFFTKPFFILLFPIIFIYVFLFISKKRGLLFLAISIATGIIAFCIANIISPVYIFNTFLNYFSSTRYSAYYAKLQIKYFLIANSIILIVSGIFAMYFLLKQKLTNFSAYTKNITFLQMKNYCFKHISITKFSQPLLLLKLPIASIALCIYVLVFYLKTGGHDGAWMTYLFQVATFFMVILISAIYLKIEKTQNSFFWASAFNVVVIYILVLPAYDYDLFAGKYKQINDLCSDRKEILASPGITALLIKQDKYIYDCGQSEYFQFCNNAGPLKFIDAVGNQSKINEKQLMHYNEKIKNKIKNKEFDLIVTPTYFFQNTTDSAFIKNYVFAEVIVNYIPNIMPFTSGNDVSLYFWKRNENIKHD